jgi:hypothetical protein
VPNLLSALAAQLLLICDFIKKRRRYFLSWIFSLLIGFLIQAYEAVGGDILLTGFLHYIQEVEDFGWRVRPLVRALPSFRLQQQQQEGLPTGAVGAD